MRLFVALEVPESWRAIAHEVTEAVAFSTNVPLRRVDPTLMHITLRFLGEVADEQVEGLSEALAGHVPPVDVALQLGRAGTFGPPARTSVAWLGIAGDLVGLRALVHRVELAVRLVGLPRSDERFAAHLTLARLARTVGAEERRVVAETLDALPPPPPLPFTAREVVLVRSRLGGRQPIYEVLGRYK